jgi:hypothetical protein
MEGDDCRGTTCCDLRNVIFISFFKIGKEKVKISKIFH